MPPPLNQTSQKSVPSVSTAFESRVAFNSERIGAAAVYCSDGRYGEQCDDFLHNSLKLPRYDRVAIPGGAAALAGHFEAYRDEEALVPQLEYLIRTHQLEHVVLIGHQNCGFYLHRLRCTPEKVAATQVADLQKAAERIWSIRSGLVVCAYLAQIEGTRVWFESVALAR